MTTSVNLGVALAAAISGYFIGSIAFARVLGRWLVPDDLGSVTTITWGENKGFFAENISATTISQRRGSRYGCFTALLDILKAAIPVLVFDRLYPDQAYDVICAVTLLAGHNFPIYYRFKGGRGSSVLLGSLLVLDPLAIPVTIFFAYVIGLFVFKDVLLAHYAGWILLLPAWFVVSGQWALLIYGLVVNLLRWRVSLPEVKAYHEYRRTGELQTREFHEAIEKTHIGYVHKILRRRGWLKYPYME